MLSEGTPAHYDCDSLIQRPLQILALLPPKLLRHLEFVVGRQHQVEAARSWGELLQLLDNRPVSVVVVDPSAKESGSLVEFQRLFGSYPSIPVLAYVPLTPAAFRAVAELSRVGLEQVILYAHEDGVERLRVTIEMARTNPLTNRMLSGLRPSLNMLPLSLAKSVQEVFEEPHRCVSAQDLATMAKLPTSRLYREFEFAALASPKKVLVAAKLLRGFAYLLDPGHSVSGVSRKLGYRKPRLFTDQASEVFGMNPSRMRTRLTEETVVTRLLEWCRRSAPESDGPPPAEDGVTADANGEAAVSDP